MNPTNDEGDIMFNTFKHLNDKSVYLNFNTADFDLQSIERSATGDIAAASYQLHTNAITRFLSAVPYSVMTNVSNAILKVTYDYDETVVSVKATLQLQNESTGLAESIEVT